MNEIGMSTNYYRGALHRNPEDSEMEITVYPRPSSIGKMGTAEIYPLEGLTLNAGGDAVGVSLHQNDNSLITLQATADVTSYSWQYSTNNGRNWRTAATIEGYRTDTITVELTPDNISYVYRCLMVTSGGSNIYSEIVGAHPAGDSNRLVAYHVWPIQDTREHCIILRYGDGSGDMPKESGVLIWAE